MKSAFDKVKDEEQKEFLKLSPLERMETMHNILLQIIAIRAQGEGASEYEIYTRYLRDNPRHYERSSRPLEEEVREMPEEYL